MCLNYPGPRCSGHTRINFRKAKENLHAANADLKAKQEALAVAKTAEAQAELHASEKAHAVAVAELNTATAKYDESKAKRAVAMEAYHKAKDEYDASPEGIKKNRIKSVDKKLTAEQREEARKAAIEGNATRNRQKEAYAFKQALDEAEANAVIEAKTDAPVEDTFVVPDVNKLDYQTQEDISRDENADPRILDALVDANTSAGEESSGFARGRYSYDLLRLTVASNPATSPATLDRLARNVNAVEDDRHELLNCVASNESASLSTLNYIAAQDDISSSIATSLVCNPNYPENESHELAMKHIDSWDVTAKIGRSSTAPVQTIEAIARYPEYLSDRSHALKNPRLPLKTLTAAYYEDGHYEVISNPNCPPEILEAVSETGSTYALRDLANGKKTPSHLLRKISSNKDTMVRYGVIDNPATPVDVYEEYSKSSDFKFRARLASSEHVPSSVLTSMAAKEKTKSVQDALKANPNFKG